MSFPTAVARRTSRTAWILTLTLAAVLFPGADVSAQAAREGFNFSIGAGSASVGATCTGCANNFFEDRIDGFSGMLRLGGAVTPRLVIGAEGMGWIKNSDGLNRRIAAASVVLLGYPSETTGFFVKSGIGFMRAIAEDATLLLQSDAIVSQVGIGMDIPMGSGVALTPYVTYLRTFGTSTWANGFLSDIPVEPNAIQFGIAITTH